MKKLLALFVALTLSTGMAFAQSQNGNVTGTITDATGAVVSGATVTLTDVDTGTSRTLKTDAAGVYDFEGVQPQNYKVAVTATGFATTETAPFNVAVGSFNKVNAKLSVGADTKVEVTADSLAGVNLENAEQSQVINSTQVVELPTETRNIYDFVALSGNVNVDPTDGGRGTGVGLGGARSASTEILLDGIENTYLFSAGVATTVPVDAVDQFRVITSNYGPQYGRASGGVVSVLTKAGTNQFHGTGWEFYRPSTFASDETFNKAQGNLQHRFVRNEFGFVVGGPLKKDKLFFFGGNEWLRVRSTNNIYFTIPDPGFIGLANANTQAFFGQYGAIASNVKVNATYSLCQVAGGPNNPATGSGTGGVCANGNPVDTKFGVPYQNTQNGVKDTSASERTRLEAAFPTITDNTTLFDYVQAVIPANAGGGAPQNTYNPIGRLDFTLSDKTQMFGRYVLQSLAEPAGIGNASPYNGFNSPFSTKAQDLVYGVTHTFSSHWIGQTQLGLLRVSNNSPLGPNPLGPTLFFNSTSLAIGGHSAVFPGYSETSASGGIPSSGPQNDIIVSPVFTYTKGRHTMTMGGQYTYVRDNHTFAIYANPQEALVQSGSNGSLINFMNGQFNYFQANINSQGKFPCIKDLVTGAQDVTAACTITTPITQPSFGRSNRYQEADAYFNEEFRATPRLTLNAGLRYELYGTQHNKNAALDSNFYFGTTGSLFDRVRAGQILQVGQTAAGVQNPNGKLWRTNYKQFAPRIAFAYDLTGDGKTSLRGGFGISYERNFGNVTYNVALNPPSQFAISLANTDNGGSGLFSGQFPISTGVLGPFSSTAGISKALPQASVRAVDPLIKPSYTEFYSLGLERQVNSTLALGITYQGERGIHQYSIANYNRAYYGQVYENDPHNYVNAATGNPLNTNRLNPQYTSINVRSADGDSHYDSMNLSARAQNLYHSGLTLTTNFTFAHQLDNTSATFASDNSSDGVLNGGVSYFDPFNKQLDYGNGDNDVKERVTIGLVYSTPSFGTHGFVRTLVEGFEIGSQYQAQTGNPFSMYDTALPVATVYTRARFLTPVAHQRTRGLLPASAGPGYYNYMDFPARGSANPTAMGYNGNYGYYVDPKVGYADLPTVNGSGGVGDTFGAGGTQGSISARNSFRGPGFQSFNADAVKKIKFRERYGIELRAELYNVLNHPNTVTVFSSGQNDVASYPYALAEKTGQRQLQLAGKFTF